MGCRRAPLMPLPPPPDSQHGLSGQYFLCQAVIQPRWSWCELRFVACADLDLCEQHVIEVALLRAIFEQRLMS